MDIFALLSNLAQQLLPMAPTWVVDTLEVLTMVLGVVIAVWTANRPVIARFLPNVLTSDRVQMAEELVTRIEKELGKVVNKKVDLTDADTVSKLILSDKAQQLLS